MAHSLPGQEPAPLLLERGAAPAAAMRASDNQKTADTIANLIRQKTHLTGYTVHVTFQDGIAELGGTVTDQGQRSEIVSAVLGVAGVTRVRDHLAIAPIAQVQATGGAPGLPPAGTLPPGLGQPPVGSLPPGVGPGGAATEPVPVFQAPPPSAYDVNPPRMPPHAWPTYAPYNNYSRVGYPQKYPYQSWPFIGPFYPFPKVPLGWRSIKLEWEDGHWWYKKYATEHDWWRIRYW